MEKNIIIIWREVGENKDRKNKKYIMKLVKLSVIIYKKRLLNY